ncbi:MAG: ABC transporter permease [Kiloniellales bacterium]|nr:ABC transporter permease [Kiloniellales bacterium]
MSVDAKDADGKLEIGKTKEGTSLVRLSGDWLLRKDMTSAEDVFARMDLAAGTGRVAVDLSQVGRWDSALVALMVQLRRGCESRNLEIDSRGAPDGLARLVDLALAVPERAGAKRTESAPPFLESMGRQTLDAIKSSGEMLAFLGEAVIALGNAARGRARFRASDVFLVLQDCGPHALPIVTLISFLVGMILAFVGLVQLQQFGADIYVANLVAVAMVREMGGMMTGIIMAGRTGAAFAAQLGTMNVSDEISAFRTLGIPPTEFLVLPRMLALIFAVPLLTVYANVVGMFGGSVVTGLLSDVSLLQYYVQTASSVTLGDWIGGLFKAVIYGIIVAIAGCLRGMQCKKSAAAVGDAATSAVVTAIVFIILAEAVLTVIYTVLGV